jgi:hypothetical protein
MTRCPYPASINAGKLVDQFGRWNSPCALATAETDDYQNQGTSIVPRDDREAGQSEKRTTAMEKMTSTRSHTAQALNETSPRGADILRLFLTIIFALFPFVVSAQQNPKAIAEGYLAEMDAACKAEGRNFLVLYDPIIEIDLGGTVEREVIFDQNGLQCEGDSLLFSGSAGPHVDVISSNGQLGYMSQRRPSIVWLDDHWALRFEMDPSVETEECAGYCFRYVYVREGKLVERYISEW